MKQNSEQFSVPPASRRPDSSHSVARFARYCRRDAGGTTDDAAAISMPRWRRRRRWRRNDVFVRRVFPNEHEMKRHEHPILGFVGHLFLRIEIKGTVFCVRNNMLDISDGAVGAVFELDFLPLALWNLLDRVFDFSADVNGGAGVVIDNLNLPA